MGLLVHALAGKNSVKGIWARSWVSCPLLWNLDNWVLHAYQALCSREEEANENKSVGVKHHRGSSGRLSGFPRRCLALASDIGQAPTSGAVLT